MAGPWEEPHCRQGVEAQKGGDTLKLTPRAPIRGTGQGVTASHDIVSSAPPPSRETLPEKTFTSHTLGDSPNILVPRSSPPAAARRASAEIPV